MGPLIAWRHDLRLLVYVRGVQTVSALGRGPSWFVCDREEVVIGPANHCYIWVTSNKERYTAMILRVSIPELKCGLRKGGTLGACFSEPPNAELGRQHSYNLPTGL
jgi:hypothetical protein